MGPTTLIREILGLLDRPQRLRILVVVVLSAFNALLEAVGALLILTLLTTLVGKNTGGVPSIMDPLLNAADGDGLIVLVALVTLGFYAVRLVTGLLEVYLQQREVHKAAADTSARVLSAQLRVPLEIYYAHNSGEFLRDSWQASEMVFRTSLLGAMSIVSESLVIAALLVTVLLLSPGATIATFVGLALIVGGIYKGVRQRMLRWGEAVERLGAECLKRLQESYGALREVRLAGAEDHFVERYERPRDELARIFWRQGTIANAPRYVLEALFVTSIVVIVLVMVASGSPTESSLSLLGVYGYVGMRMLPSANRIVTSLTNLRYGDASLRIVRDALGAPSVEPPDREGDRLTGGWSEITFDHVTFQFAKTNVPALNDISFTLRRGERLGVVGRSGAGKTTFLDLLTGLLEPTTGRILVDGRPLGEVVGSWHRRIAYVSQSVYLLDDDVRANVAFGHESVDVDAALLASSIEQAQATETIEGLPQKLDTVLGERGVRLSGGQRQRIAVARALYRDPDVLVFDEATAALDNATERSLNDAIDQLSQNRTVVVVAHRLSSVESCDRLLVLDAGRLVDQGTYQDLLATSPTFQQIATTGLLPSEEPEQADDPVG